MDGPDSLPLRLDREKPNLGKFSACRRVARTIYLGSAPISQRRQPGHRGSASQAGLRPAGRVAGHLWRCAAAPGGGGHLPVPGRQALLVLDAADRDQAGRRPRRAVEARARQGRVIQDLTDGSSDSTSPARPGEFTRIHPLPQSGQDVPDDTDARLVVLGIEAPLTSKEASNAASSLRRRPILEFECSAPRLYRNTLTFLSADKLRLQDLLEAARTFLAWDSILAERRPSTSRRTR